jgi:hypothetical protein
MESNLTPEYIQFVKEDGNLSTLVQHVIDRIQYLPGFLTEITDLLYKYESPFEEVPIEVPESEEILTSAVGTLTEKRLKPEYRKTSVCETL